MVIAGKRRLVLSLFPLSLLALGGETSLSAQAPAPAGIPRGAALQSAALPPAPSTPGQMESEGALNLRTGELARTERPLGPSPKAQPFRASPAGASRAPADPAARRAPGPSGGSAASGPAAAAPGPAILVYEEDAVHRLAEAAARKLSPGGTVVAGRVEFNTMLTHGTWDAVAVDSPGAPPSGGWNVLAGYVIAGGRAILATGGWADFSTPDAMVRNYAFGLPSSGLSGVVGFSFNGKALFDSGTTPLFHGTTTPNAFWHDHWVADGGMFDDPSLFGVADLGTPSMPVLVRGPNGRTFAAPNLDEAGDAWLADGSAVRIWQNMLQALLAPRILVYQESSRLRLASAAASLVSPAGTETADAFSFSYALAQGGWDVVVLDCPGTIPSGGWTPLVDHVKAGGRVVLSFGDWDGDQGLGDPALDAAFRVFPLTTSPFTWTGKTLVESGMAGTFAGVTMPNSSWGSNWTDDGDLFLPLGSAVGLAHVGDPTKPVMVSGNGGRTIASSVLDEAGSTWLGNGSAKRLWENLIQEVAPGLRILVYEAVTNHGLAHQAALEESPLGTTVAGASDFNAVLADGGWDVVLVDAPSQIPSGGWGPLIAYVSGGGKAVLSFWDWDTSSGQGTAALNAAFQVSLAADLALSSQHLVSSGTSSVLAGVDGSAGDWHDHYMDDGDLFLPVGSAIGLAHVGDPTKPVMVWGNAGRTVASFVIDEAGASLLSTDGGIRLWHNLIGLVTSPEASCSFRAGVLGSNPADFGCASAPVVGSVWNATIDPTPLPGGTTLSTIVAVGFGGPIQGVRAGGYEVLALPPFAMSVGLGAHQVMVPDSPGIVGLTLPAQGARVELAGGRPRLVLTNGQDLTFGF